MSEFVDKIDGFRSRIDSITNENSARRARADLLNKQIEEKKAELRELGVENIDNCKAEILKLEKKAETIAKKIDEELSNAEQKLGISE